MSYSLQRERQRKQRYSLIKDSPKVTITHSTRHIILPLVCVQKLQNRLRLDVDIVREHDLVISTHLHQGLKDTVSKSREIMDAMIAFQVLRLRDRLVPRQYPSLYTHRAQLIVELPEQCRRFVIALALDDRDKNIALPEVMNGLMILSDQ